MNVTNSMPQNILCNHLKKIVRFQGLFEVTNALSKRFENSFLVSVAYHDYWVYYINRYIKGTFIKLLFWGDLRYDFTATVNLCDCCM
jgi:hypothetical protein